MTNHTPVFPHALTIDVEDFYSIAFRDWLGRQVYPSYAVVRNTQQLLNILEDCQANATFFVLGEVAEMFPFLIKQIAAAGHEIGVHGYMHRQFFRMERDEAYRELIDAKRLIEDITGRRILGHRAPAFSIRPDTAWALEVVSEAGFLYDSSIVPFAGRRYGWPGFRADIHQIDLPTGATLIEAPMPTIDILGKALPVCGGGYLRHFPYWITQWSMHRAGRRQPVIAYMHPYDLDLTPPPDNFQACLSTTDPKTKRFMSLQMRNRHTVESKLRRLLTEYRFISLKEVIDRALDSSWSG